MSFAQVSDSIPKNKTLQQNLLNWGDYYLMNEKYSKAIKFYTQYNGPLPFKNQLNLAKAYIKVGNIQKAEESFKPIVDSYKAEVVDYYSYADLLKTNQSLAKEYREKAYKLPLIFNSVNQDVTPDNKKSQNDNYKIINLNINSEKSDFGALSLNPSVPEVIVFSSPQDIDFNKAMRKKIKSNSPVYNIFEAILDTSSFNISNVNALPESMNSIFQDGPGSLDVKRNIFYITRSSKTFGKNNLIQLDLYSIPFDKLNAKLAFPLSINGQNYSTMHPSVSADGKKLYFSSDRPGGYGGMDLYSVEILEENKYGKPINLGPDINSSSDEVFPFSFSENFLFFSSNNMKETGKLDIKIAKHLIEKRWETLTLKPPFSSPEDDFSFSLEKNLKFGLFTSNRPKGKGDDDLYAFKFTPKIKGENDNYIYSLSDTLTISYDGILKNDEQLMKNEDPLTVLFSKKTRLVKDVKNGSLLLNNNGSFLYKNNTSSKEKDSFAYLIQTDFGISDTLYVNLEKEQIPIDSFPPIYYNFNSSDLLKDYKNRIEKIISTMNTYPEMIVEVNSYTDCRGPKSYNLTLSERRTQTIISYVKKQINNPDRIFGKGYGENNILVESVFKTGIGLSASRTSPTTSTINNKTRDYIVISGLYKSKIKANSKKQKLEKLGYKPLIKTENGFIKIVVKDFEKLKGARNLINTLKNSNINAWIIKCNCCTISKENHKLNRRTDFKIIKK